jgi:hypothetical protein
MPENLPDDPELLRQMLAKMQSRVGFLEEENALLRQCLFGRKSEQTADSATPQLALFNEAESVVEPIDEAAEEEVVAPTQRRGKRKPLPADLPRIEVIHELPENDLDTRQLSRQCLTFASARHRGNDFFFSVADQWQRLAFGLLNSASCGVLGSAVCSGVRPNKRSRNSLICSFRSTM